mgnify:CR=1 FL=1
MFDIGPGEFALLAVLGIVLVGPEKLPGMLRQALSVMRTLRGQVANARAELDATIGPQVGEMVDMVAELNPKRLIDGDLGRPATARGGVPTARAQASDSLPSAPIIDADTP